MSRKLAIVLSVLLAVLLLMSACQASSGKLYFDSEDKIDIASVTLYVAAEGRDITAELDIDALIALLREMECGRNRKAPDSYPLSSVRYEIDGIYGHEPFHIVLGDGKLNFIYSTMDKGSCAIIDHTALKSFLDNR